MTDQPVPTWNTQGHRPGPDLSGVTTVVCAYSTIAGVPSSPLSTEVVNLVLKEHGLGLTFCDLSRLGPALRHHSATPTRSAAPHLVRWILGLYRPHDVVADGTVTAIVQELFARTPDTPVGVVGRSVVRELLDANYRVAVATNTLRPWAQRRATLDEGGLNAVDLITSSSLEWAKPDPRFYAHTLAHLEADPELVLWVGPDEQRDVNGPRRASVRALRMRSGLDDRLDPWARSTQGPLSFEQLPTLLGAGSVRASSRGA